MDARKIIAVLCLVIGAGRVVSGMLYMTGTVTGLDFFVLADSFLVGPVIFTAGYMLLQDANEEGIRSRQENI